jgi:hypothetical protein
VPWLLDPGKGTVTPFREDLWNLPAWQYPIDWALVILCGALGVYGL